jgi:hypothetical protein
MDKNENETKTKGRPQGSSTGRKLPKEHFTDVLDGKATLFKRRVFDAFIPNAHCYAEEKNALIAHCNSEQITLAQYIRGVIVNDLASHGYDMDFVTAYPVAQWEDGELIPIGEEEL